MRLELHVFTPKEIIGLELTKDSLFSLNCSKKSRVKNFGIVLDG